MKHHYLPYIFLVALLVIGFGAWYNSQYQKPYATQTTPKSTQSAITPAPNAKKATISLSAPSATVGTPLPLSVKINADPIAISGFSLRLVYSYPTTQVFSVPNKFVISSKLLSANWAGAINSVVVDQQKKTATMDLSLILANPKGYTFASNEEVATISLMPIAKGSGQITVDTSKVTIVGKGGETFNVIAPPLVVNVN